MSSSASTVQMLRARATRAALAWGSLSCAILSRQWAARSLQSRSPLEAVASTSRCAPTRLQARWSIRCSIIAAGGLAQQCTGGRRQSMAIILVVEDEVALCDVLCADLAAEG